MKILGYLLWMGIFITGCVSAPIAPNLKIPEKTCPRLELPPVPEKVNLSIDGDRILIADPGGETVLRGFVQARDLLR